MRLNNMIDPFHLKDFKFELGEKGVWNWGAVVSGEIPMALFISELYVACVHSGARPAGVDVFVVIVVIFGLI